MGKADSNTTVIQRDDDKIAVNNERTQVFGKEDFVQVYEDNLQNYENLLNQLQQIRDQRKELIEENEDELAALNHLIESEEAPEDYTPGNLENSLNDETFQTHQQLKEFREQVDQLESQKNRLEEQLQEMSDVATMLDDDVEEFTPSQ